MSGIYNRQDPWTLETWDTGVATSTRKSILQGQVGRRHQERRGSRWIQAAKKSCRLELPSGGISLAVDVRPSAERTSWTVSDLGVWWKIVYGQAVSESGYKQFISILDWMPSRSASATPLSLSKIGPAGHSLRLLLRRPLIYLSK